MIDHFVVLMYENRSFDHLLGLLDHPKGIKGLTGKETNPVGKCNPTPIPVSGQATGILHTDPGHKYQDVLEQLFQHSDIQDPAQAAINNKGFVENFQKAIDEHHDSNGSSYNASDIMKCFDHQNTTYLKAFRRLALEYAICDRWFCSVPGSTWPNRQFVHSGTSRGTVDNKVWIKKDRTVYEMMADNGRTWNIYSDGPATSHAYYKLFFKKNGGFRSYRKFASDVANGALANYVFIEPRHFKLLKSYTNDMHPGHNKNQDVDFIGADNLLYEVYSTLTSNPEIWNKTVLVVTFDEHGGFYDHMAPPVRDEYTPDHHVWKKDTQVFNFNMLGLRVPTLIISPFIKPNTVDTRVYDHTSIIATAQKIFNINDQLTRRVKKANTFEHLFQPARRRELPQMEFPIVDPVDVSLATLSTTRESVVPTEADDRLNDLQHELYDMTRIIRAIKADTLEETEVRVERLEAAETDLLEGVLPTTSIETPDSEGDIKEELLSYTDWFDAADQN